MLPRRLPRDYITQRNLRLAIISAFLIVVIGFFAYQFKFLRAPELVIHEPAEDRMVSDGSFEVRGQTDPDADLTLNGRPLYSGDTGDFSERIYLVKGVNRLEFEARNRYGKMAKVVRYLIYR